MRGLFSTPILVAALMMVSIGSLPSVSSFTYTRTSPRVVGPVHRDHAFLLPNNLSLFHQCHHSSTSNKIDSSLTSLQMNYDGKEETTNRNRDTYGMGNGNVILVIALLLNVWLFSIPPEFRRARICSVEDVQLYPEKHCTTYAAWRKGVADYYANGGGVHFDFSVEGRE